MLMSGLRLLDLNKETIYLLTYLLNCICVLGYTSMFSLFRLV